MKNFKTKITFLIIFNLIFGLTSLLSARECLTELEAFSAVSKTYGQKQVNIYSILRENALLKITNPEGNQIIKRIDDINTESIHLLMQSSPVATDNIYLLDAYAKLVNSSLQVLDYQHQIELCFGKHSRKESVTSYMKGYTEGANTIKRAYGLDKLKF